MREMRDSQKRAYILLGLMAALLFGAGSQLSKLMLTTVHPVTMAGLLYLGSGLGLLLLTVFSTAFGKKRESIEARLTRKDLPWLFTTMFFGTFLAPVILMLSLRHTPATTVALLLNFEAVATTIVAVIWAREPIGKRIWGALALITVSCVVLTYKPDAAYGVSIGALGVILTCTFWGLDNNIIQHISDKDPMTIVMLKGLCVGSFTFLLSRVLGESLPEIPVLLSAMAIGFMGFGGVMSICLVLAIRGLGSSRAAALISLSPFFGVGFAFLLFADMPGTLFFLAFAIMLAGTYLLLTEQHTHEHTHPAERHEHRHRHDDLHHNHEHTGEMPPVSSFGYHSHIHVHEELPHTHPHSPDIHHRHRH
jgi:drug/metabolite transporter (DMT)-like permease